MTSTETTVPVPFPGLGLAVQRAGGGWEKTERCDPRALPTAPLAPETACQQALSPDDYRRQWLCTAHMDGWHAATAMNGHVVAIWPVTS